MAKHLTLSEAQQQFYKLPDDIIVEPVIITHNGQPVMIAINPSQLESLLETVEILLDKPFCEQLREGINQANQQETISLEALKMELGL